MLAGLRSRWQNRGDGVPGAEAVGDLQAADQQHLIDGQWTFRPVGAARVSPSMYSITMKPHV